jgi:hypothetical protein
VAAILWLLDEWLYPKYRQVEIKAPIFIVSVPRAGITSFHRTIALDEDQLVTPTMLELVLLFLCVQKIIWKLHSSLQKCCNDGSLFEHLSGITQGIDARHPVQLLAPDADDILIGEWHWTLVGSLRTF